MVTAALTELEQAGVTDAAEVVVADAGYWHQKQMESVVNKGIQVLIPPDAGKRRGTRPGWDGGRYAHMRRVLESELGGGLYRKRKAMIEPVFAQHQVQPPDRPLPTPRKIRRTLRVATDHRHPQPPEAPQAPNSRRGGLKGLPPANRKTTAPSGQAPRDSLASDDYRRGALTTAGHTLYATASLAARRRP